MHFAALGSTLDERAAVILRYVRISTPIWIFIKRKKYCFFRPANQE
jgi:hypothetical protein